MVADIASTSTNHERKILSFELVSAIDQVEILPASLPQINQREGDVSLAGLFCMRAEADR